MTCIALGGHANPCPPPTVPAETSSWVSAWRLHVAPKLQTMSGIRPDGKQGGSRERIPTFLPERRPASNERCGGVIHGMFGVDI